MEREVTSHDGYVQSPGSVSKCQMHGSGNGLQVILMTYVLLVASGGPLCDTGPDGLIQWDGS